MNECTMLCDAARVEVPQQAAAQGAQQPGGGLNMLMPMLLILAIFYFMMIRPQQRKEKERRKMIEELRAGAKIVFAGGLMGVIAEATEKTFVVELAGGVKMEILRSCVQSVIPPEGASAQ
ncbi:MAG: preprotein translocase subunit YajC [Kiritimatiellae bacterium]|nr:preprotein translocase subunit YajC [Kiritimatiellia bacterium]